MNAIVLTLIFGTLGAPEPTQTIADAQDEKPTTSTFSSTGPRLGVHIGGLGALAVDMTFLGNWRTELAGNLLMPVVSKGAVSAFSASIGADVFSSSPTGHRFIVGIDLRFQSGWTETEGDNPSASGPPLITRRTPVFGVGLDVHARFETQWGLVLALRLPLVGVLTGAVEPNPLGAFYIMSALQPFLTAGYRF